MDQGTWKQKCRESDLNTGRGFSSRASGSYATRVRVIAGVIGLLMALYLGYLFYLQIIRGREYAERAIEVYRRETSISAQRGKIFDRNLDTPLATNVNSFAVGVVPAKLPKGELTSFYQNLSTIIGIPSEEIRDTVSSKGNSSYGFIEIEDGVPLKTIAQIAERLDEFSGVTWKSKPIRLYNDIRSISHIVGYVGNITAEDLQILYNQGYERNSTVGKAGIEKQYDALLRGKDGVRYSNVDVRGRSVSPDEGTDIPPQNGKDLVLTIDRGLQTLAEKTLGDRTGSVVILKPDTGEILAMVSFPWFDPNEFYTPQRGEAFTKLSLDSRFPFLNRVIQSTYAPASTFKVILTTALIEEESIPLSQTIDCLGKLRYGGRDFHCHLEIGHGDLTLEGALAESCNVFFYTAGTHYLGIDQIAKYSNRFGYGMRTGVDLPGEVPGLVPTPEWKKRTYNSSWVGGDTMNVSIGQGFLSVTPLQLANAIAAIANNGVAYRPHLLKEIRDPTTGKVIETIQPERQLDLNIRPGTYKLVQEYMRGVITDGTARWVITTEATKVAGKTGTGEVGAEDKWSSWFVAYAPYGNNPQDEKVVVVVNIEGTNEWEWWAPKAADMIFQGIFAEQTYEEVREEFKDRWYLREQ